MYEKSYMHRDIITHTVCTRLAGPLACGRWWQAGLVSCRTDFIITASSDGHVKFWKKQEQGVEFVKHFRAHLGRAGLSGGLAS